MTIIDPEERLKRSGVAGEVQAMHDKGCEFLKAGSYTLAFCSAGEYPWQPHPKGLVRVSTAVRNLHDDEDPLTGQAVAGKRLLLGESVLVKVPKGRNVRRFLRGMFS